MFKPSAFSSIPIKNLNRVKLTGLSLALLTGSFVGFGLTSDPTQVSEDKPKIFESDSVIPTRTQTSEVVEPAIPSGEVAGVAVENQPTDTPTYVPTNTPFPTRIPTSKPTSIPTTIPTRYSTPVPPVYFYSTPIPTSSGGSGSWVCNCSKTCPNMSSCAEAQYQLNVCGCGARDADNDGIACDVDCQ